MPARKTERDLGRRERQIMEVLYSLGSGSVGDVLKRLEDPPSYSAVRAMITILEGKGYLRHSRQANKYIYFPTRSRKSVSRSALKHLISTFFGGSAGNAVAAILDDSAATMSPEELNRLAEAIEIARRQGN